MFPLVALTREEVAAAVGQRAMAFRESAAAPVETQQSVALGLPNAQILQRFSVARDGRPRAE